MKVYVPLDWVLWPRSAWVVGVLLVFLGGLTAPDLCAQTLFWDTTGVTAGTGTAPSGNWTGANWSTDSTGSSATSNFISGRAAVFSAGNSATGTYTVTLTGTQNVSSVTVKNGTVTFTGGTINFNDTTPDFSVASGLTATVQSVVAGANGLNKTGDGTLLFTGTNTYTGLTTVSAGTLQIANASGLGANSGGATVSSGATLALSGGITVPTGESLSLSGSGVNNNGALLNVSGSNTWSGNLTLAANAKVGNAAAGSRLTLGSTSYTQAIALGANTITFDGAGDTWLNAAVNGTGGLVKSGTGTLTFYSNGNSYTGATSVNEGTLVLDTLEGSNLSIKGSVLNIGDGTGAAGSAVVQSGSTVSPAANEMINNSATLNVLSDGLLNLNTQTETLGQINMTGGEIRTGTGGALLLNNGAGIGITTNASASTALIDATGGSLSLNGLTRTFAVANGSAATDLEIRGAILNGSATAGIVKTGAGNLLLSGTVANTYTGTTAINDGTVSLGKTAGVNALGTGAITVGDGSGAAGSANLALLASNQIADTAAITINADGRLALGTSSESVATIAGTGQLDLGSSGYLILGANNSSSTFGGSIIGTGTLEKAGSGLLALSNAINFGGTLTLSGGTLQLSGTAATIGTLNITGNSTIDFAGSSTLSLTNLSIGTGVTLNILNWTGATDYFYTVNWTGASFDTMGSTPMNQITFNGFPASQTGWDSFDHQIRPNVPEPSTYGALLFGTLASFVAVRRWRARRSE